jgi:hypothetical protein
VRMDSKPSFLSSSSALSVVSASRLLPLLNPQALCFGLDRPVALWTPVSLWGSS